MAYKLFRQDFLDLIYNALKSIRIAMFKFADHYEDIRICHDCFRYSMFPDQWVEVGGGGLCSSCGNVVIDRSIVEAANKTLSARLPRVGEG